MRIVPLTRHLLHVAFALGCVLATQSLVAEPVRLTGAEAFGDWRKDAPGTLRLIRPHDLPPPGATPSSATGSRIVPRASSVPQVPPGFKVELFADGLSGPRILRVAPNGDAFVAESWAGRISLLRAPGGGARAEKYTYASGLKQPFGIAFFPAKDPRWVYVAEASRIVRFAYKSGDLAASGSPQTIAELPRDGNHWTRDILFAADDSRLYVSVGSASNDGEGMDGAPGGVAAWQEKHALGAAWGGEAERADVLTLDPDGKNRSVFATGIRNCSGLARQPSTGAVWCATNERDGLGDDLVPDFVTRVSNGTFFGWPWYYIGANEDPRRRGERPDLRGRITVPDVLLQPHSAPLEMVFYDADLFPAGYRGDAFVALHGSWNRSKRTGYKVVRIRLKDGTPTGEYEDFITGFVLDDQRLWGRPVGVAVAHDGALLVSEDAAGTVWRVAPVPSR